jgi:hypothetical protein
MINFETITEKTTLLSSLGIFTAVRSQTVDQTFIGITEFYNITECPFDKDILWLKKQNLVTVLMNKTSTSSKLTSPPPPLKQYHSGNLKIFRTMTGLLNGFSEKYLQQCCLEWTF